MSCQFTNKKTTVCLGENYKYPIMCYRVYKPFYWQLYTLWDQSDVYVLHPKKNQYFKESDIDDDNYRYADDDVYEIMLKYNEWKIDYKARFAEYRERFIKDMEVSKAELR